MVVMVMRMLVVGMLLLLLFVVVDCARSPRLRHTVFVFVQDANAAVFPNAVAHLQRVDPQGQLAGEDGVEELDAEADGFAGLADQRVELAVDADAPEAGALERLLGEPVVAVPPSEDVDQGVVEPRQLGLGHVASGQPDQVDQEVGRAQQLQLHVVVVVVVAGEATDAVVVVDLVTLVTASLMRCCC